MHRKGSSCAYENSHKGECDGTMALDKSVPKTPSKFTKEDEKEVHKDKKAMNILFNGIDKYMFGNVINCTTFKGSFGHHTDFM